MKLYFYQSLKFTLFGLLIFYKTTLFAQTCSISGTVIDKSTNEPLIGANILLEGTNIGTISDFDGHFCISDLPEKKYNLKISYVSYMSQLLEDIPVRKGNSSVIKVFLETNDLGLEEVTIKAVRKTNTEVAIVSNIKKSDLVVSGISNEQISRSQDRDASEVVKRVPGITIIDDRFVVVRGLNCRYNSVWLNNSATPSSEADIKAFSFDVIPSSLIDNLMIYKTTAPELPADFAGGFVKIATKNMPDLNSVSVSYSSSFAEGTTFQDFYRTQGGKFDFLGFDDNSRAMPSHFPSDLKPVNDKNILAQYGRDLNKNWTAKKIIAIPDQRIGITYTRKIKFDKFTIGNTSALNYSYTFDNVEIINRDYQVYDFVNDTHRKNFDFLDNQYTNTAKIGFLHNWSLYYGRNNKFEIRTIFNQIGKTKTSMRNGDEYYNGNTLQSYEFAFMSRATFSGQLAGEHCFYQKNTVLDWNIGYSYADRNEPDIKRIQTTKITDLSSSDYGKYSASIDYFVSPYYSGRLFLDMNENIWSGSTNFLQKFKFDKWQPELRAGLYFEHKERQFNARNLGYKRAGYNFDQSITTLPLEQLFSDENINAITGMILSEDTKKSDVYKASNNQIAAYFSLKIPITKYVSLYTGLRLEDNTQKLSSHDIADNPVEPTNKSTNLFPSANLSINISEKSLIRVAYGISINRPEFREIAPFNFFDFKSNASVSGNPNLKDAKIYNYDLRYELYPSGSETFSVGCFYKHFENPIELKYNETGSGLAFTYQNADAAKNYGVEIDVRKSLSFMSLNNFSLVCNAALIRSRIYFAEGSVERNRPMQGQSPYIVNTGIYYQNDNNGLMMSLLYNVIGKRIYIVGQVKQQIEEDIPDIYELPRNVLDFSFSKKIGKRFEIKGGVKDLLSENVVFCQTVKFSDSDKTRAQNTSIFNPGRYYTLGVIFKL